MPLQFRKAVSWLSSLMGDVDLRRISTPIRVERESKIQVSTAVKGEKKQIDALQIEFSFTFRGTDGSDLKSSGRLFIPTNDSHDLS